MTEKTSSSTILRACDVTKVFGFKKTQVTALREINCTLSRGELVVIMGPSGSGKSTMLYSLSGVDPPTSGKVWIDDAEVTAMADEELTLLRRRKLGFVFQDFNLLPNLNVMDNVILPLLLDGVSSSQAEDKATHILETVGMTDRIAHRPAELSGGEQQRVAIARALATAPIILFADEPTGNLDTKHGQQVIGLIRSLVDQRNQAVMLVTHDPQIAKHADRVIVLVDGRIQFDGPVAEHAAWISDSAGGRS